MRGERGEGHPFDLGGGAGPSHLSPLTSYLFPLQPCPQCTLPFFRRRYHERQASCHHRRRCAAAREPEAELSLVVAPPTVQRAAGGDAARVRAPPAEIGEGVPPGDRGWAAGGLHVGGMKPLPVRYKGG